MKKFEPNQIICEDSQNLDNILSPKSIDLTIVVPPFEYLESYSKLKSFLEKIEKVTKPGGTCCFFVEDMIDPKSDSMSMKGTKFILQILDTECNWILDDKIIWVKSTKKNTDETSEMNSGSAISFQDTPFSTIYVLVKNGSDFEPVDFREKAQSLLISPAEKEEFMDDFWYIHPVSEKGFKDRIPEKLVSRLVMLFSNENEIVLDPFAGYGAVGKIATELSRKYICIEKSEINSKIAFNRINQIK